MNAFARERPEFFMPESLRVIWVRSLIIGVVALLVVCIFEFGVHRDTTQFFRSYLLAWEYWNNFCLGCLAVLMLTNIAGGRWGFVIRRPLEAATRLLPLTAILGIPWLVWGVPYLYLWANAAPHQDEHLSHSLWLTRPGFTYRYITYFLAWIVLVLFLNRYSAELDHNRSLLVKRKLASVSGPGLVIYVLTATFSSIDWLMSLDPLWSSTIYGLLLIAGQCLAAFAFMVIVVVILGQRSPMTRIVHPDQLHQLGKLTLTFVMLWAYFSFSQLLLQWAGNLPEEIKWYLQRIRGGWWWLGMGLIFLHFALPFALLLSRDLKRSARPLVLLASLIIVMRWGDLFYLIAPNPLPMRPDGVGFSWADILFTVGLGGLWMGAFFRELGKRPLVPLYDPMFEQVVAHAGKP